MTIKPGRLYDGRFVMEHPGGGGGVYRRVEVCSASGRLVGFKTSWPVHCHLAPTELFEKNFSPAAGLISREGPRAIFPPKPENDG